MIHPAVLENAVPLIAQVRKKFPVALAIDLKQTRGSFRRVSARDPLRSAPAHALDDAGLEKVQSGAFTRP
jgi:hypothetical protein